MAAPCALRWAVGDENGVVKGAWKEWKGCRTT